MNNEAKHRKFLAIQSLRFAAIGFVFALQAVFADATGVIDTTIGKMVTILNVLIIGIMVWSGFLLARGDSSAVQRIIYGIIGLVVVNSARILLEFFKF